MLAGTLELMRRCDAVILVHNWRDSAGSRAEVDEAKRLGIPVFGLAQSGTIDDGALAGLCRWAAAVPLPEHLRSRLVDDHTTQRGSPEEWDAMQRNRGGAS
jgi:hypothetical protein